MTFRDRLLILICAVAFACNFTLHAQTTIITDLSPGTVPLDGEWRFTIGDDPAWAQPTFDDSHWQTIDIAQPWGDQGHWAYGGHAWYRRAIQFNGTTGQLPLGLFVPETNCAYEVYWNGRLIGGTDAMPGPPMINFSALRTFTLGAPQSGVLAFRVFTTPPDSTTAGNALGIMSVPQLGSVEAVQNLAAKEDATVFRRRFLVIVQLLGYLPLFLFAFIVWLHHRHQKLLFWVAAFLFSSTLWILVDSTVFPWTLSSPALFVWSGPPFHTLIDISLWYVLLYLLQLDQRYPTLPRWTRTLAWIALLGSFGDCIPFLLPNREHHVLAFIVLDAIATFFFSVPAIYPLVLIVLAFRRPLDTPRRLVAIAAFLSDMVFVIAHTAEQGERYTRWTLYSRMTAPLFTLAGVDITTSAILALLLVTSIVYAVYRYIMEQGQRQSSIEQEFLNARTVQQVLVPDAITPVPGFSIQSVYKPFGEVGGDFFQIIPMPDGSVMAVIGDVSGKGMPAAMTVALLVGTVRTLAFYERSPAQIMFAMNLRMCGRSQGGFTTCLVLRADLDGTITAASAGHLSPYIAGREVTVPSGLALGLVPNVTYDESQLHLSPGEQLTLLTDGVIEARSHLTGELFGFDRTATHSAQSAESIAAAAQHFGQDDDITVLTLCRNP